MPILVVYGNDIIKSIMYVAIFVACMFLLSGVLRKQAANNSIKQVLEAFLKYLRNGDFESFNREYPGFINYDMNAEAIGRDLMREVTKLQQIAFEQTIRKFSFRDYTNVKIENVIKKPFQYETRTDISVTGHLVFRNGSVLNFYAVLQQNKMYSFMIEDECVLNDRCFGNYQH